VKSALVNALCAWVDERRRKKARRFLEGLSADELQHIADFLGACLLESSGGNACAQLEEAIARFEALGGQAPPPPRYGTLNDREHKAILLAEFLHRCELNGLPPAVRASRGAA